MYSQEELREIADTMAAEVYKRKSWVTPALLEMLQRMDGEMRRTTLLAFESGRGIHLNSRETSVLVNVWKSFRAVLQDNGYESIIDTAQEGPCFRRMVYTIYSIWHTKSVNAETIKLTVYFDEEPADMSCNSCTGKATEDVRYNAPIFQATTVTYVTFGGIADRNVKDLKPEEIQTALEKTEARLSTLRAIPEPRPAIINKQIDELVDARNKFVTLVDETFKE